MYVTSVAKFDGNITLLARYHVFQPNEGNFDYGSEVDLQLTKKMSKVTLAAKHASYFGSDDEAAGALGIDKYVTWFFVNYAL